MGSQSSDDNTIGINLDFSLNNFKSNVSTVDSAEETLLGVDKLKKNILKKQSEISAIRNRLVEVIDNQNNELINLKASNSIIKDTNYASEAINLTKSQILSSVVTTLMSQCGKNNADMALKLLNF